MLNFWSLKPRPLVALFAARPAQVEHHHLEQTRPSRQTVLQQAEQQRLLSQQAQQQVNERLLTLRF